MIPGVPQIGGTEMLILLVSISESRKVAMDEPQEDKRRELDEKKQLSKRESARIEEEKTGVG